MEKHFFFYSSYRYLKCFHFPGRPRTIAIYVRNDEMSTFFRPRPTIPYVIIELQQFLRFTYPITNFSKWVIAVRITNVFSIF